MDILDGLYQNFLRFFSWEEISFLFTGTGLLVMTNLVLSEVLLSFDNALVLAIMVSHLPRDQYFRLGPIRMSIQRWALTTGILSAYLFRILAIGIGTYLIQFWFLELLGGGYLLWLGMEHFLGLRKKSQEARPNGRGFWATVIKVELMDIAFSIDSILAALGISQKVWVILMGGVIGILCMRFVAGLFLRLLHRFPLFKHTGYALVSFIGFRLVSEVDWSHLDALVSPLDRTTLAAILLGALVLWIISHLLRPRLNLLKSLLQLAVLLLAIPWASTRWHLHMGDLTFSIIMLATFASTFLLNGLFMKLGIVRRDPQAPSLDPDAD